jgi:RNA polymerase sigma-70 factor (ECF subfamily)
MAELNGSAREDVLHRAVLGGDELAWRMLYESSFDGLYRYVQWRTGGLRDWTDEVVGETWLTAVRRIRTFDPHRGDFLHWVRGIAVNVLRNHQRREHLRNAGGLSIHSEPATRGSASGPLEEREKAQQIAAALAQLPEHYEYVLRAKYVDGQSVAQIAAGRGETEKAVESLLTRAREAFRKAYDPGHD